MKTINRVAPYRRSKCGSPPCSNRFRGTVSRDEDVSQQSLFKINSELQSHHQSREPRNIQNLVLENTHEI